MSWSFYSKEGKLQYDLVAGSVGDADTLDGIDSTGFVRIGVPGFNVGNVDIDGSLTLPANILSANTLLDATYRTVLIDSSAAPRTITLPASPLTGQIYEIRDVGSTGTGASATNNITIARNGNTINGVASDLILSENGRGVVLVWDGFKWITLADRTVSVGSTDADTLDSLDSTQFLRSDIDDTAAGNITFSKSIYNPVDILNDTTNPNLLNDTYRTVVADPFTNSAPVTITLPASPIVGQWYEILDSFGGATSNNITIARNGSTIDGVAADITLNVDFDSIILVCTDTNTWSIVTWRFPPSVPTSTSFDGLSDVTITAPTEGELVRFDTPANEWVNTPNATLDDAGQLHLKDSGSFAGIVLGENLGVGMEVFITPELANTLQFTGRTVHAGTKNDTTIYLENGVNPAGDTYDVIPPIDNTFLCNTSAGNLFIRLTTSLSTVPVLDGDTLLIKDAEGFADVNGLVLVAEGVRRRNVPELTLDSPTGTIASAITTTTSGGIGVDEVQNFQVTGSGTYEINFDGQITSSVLTELSTALAVETAINSLSPHPNYGYFSVSVTGTDALGGLAVTFDGGAVIDGEASFSMTSPWESAKVLYKTTLSGGNWFII